MIFRKKQSKAPWIFAILGMVMSTLSPPFLMASELPVVIPPPVIDSQKTPNSLQSAVLAGGCFWGVQGVFEHVRGVHKVLAGYSGGDKFSARYETVSTGTTGHAESVQILFNPAEVSYGELLQIFFSVAHDPTQVDRQGPDAGTQYRSAIFYADDTQKSIAQAYVSQLDKLHAFPHVIATRIERLGGFYPAENHHQDFLIHNPNYPYIVINDLPKIENLKRIFPVYYRSQPALVGSTIFP